MFPYQRQGSGLVSFFVTVIGLAVVGIPFYFIVARQGWGALSAMPYAIPVAAVALAVVLFVGHHLTGTAPQPGGIPLRRGNPAGGIVGGLILVGAGIFMSFKSGGDVRRYQNDPSCSAGFTAAGAAGACSLDQVRIIGAYACGRHNASDCIRVERSDGTSRSVTLARDYRGSVYRGARDSGDRFAEVQYFDGRIVQVETRSGRSATSDMPLERERLWTLIGMVGGFFGLIAAAVVLVRGIF
jgi:hypothetical protein